MGTAGRRRPRARPAPATPSAGGAAYDKDSLLSLIETLRPRFDTVQELVLEALRQGILQGVLPPNVRLRQEDLAAVFDVSRIPVREALRALEYEGLVRSEPHRGFTVTALDADAIAEIYDLRILLEGHAVHLAIPLLTADDLTDLADIHGRMGSVDDVDVRQAARDAFSVRLYSVTARPRLTSLIGRLRSEVTRSAQWKRVQHASRHLDEFHAAVLNGDGIRAVSELQAHHQNVASLLQRFVREEGTRRPPTRQ